MNSNQESKTENPKNTQHEAVQTKFRPQAQENSNNSSPDKYDETQIPDVQKGPTAVSS